MLIPKLIQSCRPKFLLLFTLFVYLIALNAPSNATGKFFIYETVYAEKGGTFSDDPHNPNITITIPPGALSADAKLVAYRAYPNRVGENQTAASPAFRVRLKRLKARWWWRSRVRLSQPMEVAIASAIKPAHPQIGEIAMRSKGAWHRMTANFYRASSDEAVALTKRTRAKFRVVHRTLQARSGDAVERGRDLYFNESWGSDAYWGGVFQLHEVLNAVDLATAASLGAQLDISKVPQSIVDVLLSDDYAAKQAALADPVITRALIKAGAVLGLKGFFNDAANPDRQRQSV